MQSLIVCTYFYLNFKNKNSFILFNINTEFYWFNSYIYLDIYALFLKGYTKEKTSLNLHYSWLI